jgi:hypothetical protein
MRFIFFAARLALACIIMSIPAGFAYAQEFEYVDYTVKKGDTLWSITKTHLEDAFQWPLVWRENLRINNPDLIYPGQVIRVPIRALGPGIERPRPTAELPVEAGPEETAVDVSVTGPVFEDTAEEEEIDKASYYGLRRLMPSEAKEVTSREIILESGYIAWEQPDAGRITGSPRGRKQFGQFDDIYVKTTRPAVPGNKYYVVRSHENKKVKHPITGEKIGYLWRVLGIIEVQETGTKRLKAKVIESFDALILGDRLDYYYEVVPPIQTGEPRKPQVTGHVVASKYMRGISGQFDIVFIDKGIEDGLKAGDVLMTLLKGTDDRRNATIQIVNLRRATSLALVIASEDEIRFGDVVQGIMEE